MNISLRLNREVDRTVMAVVTQRAFDINIDTSCGAFPDVDITHPGYEYITTLKCKGIIGGYSDGNYKPSEMVDRGMTAKFIARAACLEVDNHNAAYCSGNEPAPEISVQFTAPAANAVIGPSSQVIQTDVQGNDIDHVTFYAVYDGELHYLGDDTAAPYEMGWETPAVIDQKVKLVVHAVTSAGNFAEDYRMINFVGFSDGVKRTLPIENRYYLNQRSLYPSGDIKCASASAAMVLAMNGTIGGDYESMKNTANSIWSEIGVPDIGKVSNAINKRGYNTEVLNGDLNSKWDRLKSEINAGHPVIIDSYHGMTSDGHFIVAVGYEDNDDPAQRNIYVYDPFGKHSSCYPASQCPTSGDRWDKLNTYSADSSNGRWVVYPWNKLQDYMALGVIVVRPNTQRVIAKTTGLDFEPEFISTEPSGVEGEPYGNHASSLTFIAESSQAQSFQFSGELGDFSLETMPITGTANISNSYVSQEHQFPHVSPETITIYANSTTGWVLNKVTCDNGTQFVSSSNNDLSSIDISLNLGDDVTCIFTYDLGDNNSGDGTWATDWTATFAGGDQSLCQHEPGWINTTLTVKPIPAGSKGYLQTDWYVVGNNPSTCPADDANCMDSHYQSQLIEGETTIQLRAWWPGIYAEDGVVENHFSANLLDENHNVIHDGIGQDFYWYPWVCSAPDPSPGSIKIVKESNPHTGQSFDFASDLGAFSLYQGMAKSFSDLTAGTYNVSESNRTLLAADNWSLLSVTCREQHGYHVPPQTDLTNFSAMINMKSGQDLTCTFLNEKVNLESDVRYSADKNRTTLT
ncbi:MAG: hypothetical protein B6242_14590 [Anaerolineaceae bacterium 4572_78]|nr:MAG: hypothetical protein B6242_14590 [Anaerolineaceae bacterium 4572_78]